MKISADFVVEKIGDNYYAVPLVKKTAIGNSMIKLNESAYLVWEGIKNGLTLEEIAENFTKEYVIDKDTAKRDVTAFVLQLGKVGILEGTDEA